MLVSWDWLKQYVALEMSVEELTDRLTMSGLNLEEYEAYGKDWVIDLEVTSNRPDCLGHLGVAREIAVLYDQTLKIPAAQPVSCSSPAAKQIAVRIDAPELCSQYHARVIRGVKIGPSPAWMQQRLQAVGIACVNNVVDITNYVMLECAQPLHAFDLDRLHGAQIIVRPAKKGEKFKAINQKEYELSPEMCLIADAQRPVALAGVMGGFDSEISDRTTNVLIEAALFAPLSVRNTARKLDLHSPSSYRFERALDPQGPDYASRRCCELILELAGGELCEGVVSAGETPAPSGPEISLRFARFQKVLGIDIPAETAIGILQRLGLEQIGTATAERATFRAPTWRRDLSREIDLIEEVARIYGYDHLSDDVAVPLCSSSKSQRERVVERIGETLTAVGFHEAMTAAFTSENEQQWFNPRPDVAALYVDHSSRRQENLLRRSLIPSLITCRRANERHGNFQAKLFEIAKVYLAADPDRIEHEVEPWQIGLVTGQSYLELKGVTELLARRIQPHGQLTVRPCDLPQFTPGRGAEVLWNGVRWGWLGELDRSVCDAADLRDVVCVAELDLQLAERNADLVPRAQKLPEYPGMVRDLNFVLDEPVLWSDLEQAVRSAAGPLLEQVQFASQYRGKQLGADKKSYVVTLTFRAPDRTLTSDEVDAAQAAVVKACESSLQATLRA
ncbi:phenylalanine--tRNA ligase subunit beta [bacterium]|nr:phenylalanine--tRNA ligase subunit beta [bacterium]